MYVHLSRPIVLRTNSGLISRRRGRRLLIPESCLLCLAIFLVLVANHGRGVSPAKHSGSI